MTDLTEIFEAHADADAKRVPSPEALTEIAQMARAMQAIEQAVAALEAELKSQEENLRRVAEEYLPEAMAAVGLSEIKLDTGERLTIQPFYRASIPQDKSIEAFNWLIDAGHGDLIKNVVSLTFGKTEDSKATSAISLLRKAGYRPEARESVHTSTLKAFVKEQIEAGKPLPMDLLGAYAGRRAAFKKSK